MIPIVHYEKKAGKELADAIIARPQEEYKEAQAVVDAIIEDVRANGDKALFAYTMQFDGAQLESGSLCVSQDEIDEAYASLDAALLEVIKKSVKRVADFHERQKPHGFMEPFEDGEIMGQMIQPLGRVGIYAPGGEAAYPSSVIMCAVPAKVAGVTDVVMATPPGPNSKINPAVLAAAVESGVTRIYKAGGAQAVAMLAFGTESVPKVDKIVGPGNIYVALAKRSVYGYVDIDSVAGPSEVLIIADDKAKPAYVAADLLAQAEHGKPAPCVLVTTSAKLAEKVAKELVKQAEELGRRAQIEKALKTCGAAIIVESLSQAVELANEIAPEHLEICVKHPFALLGRVRNAGAVFLGNYTPEAMGDYMAGPSHVLPTGATARFFSALSVDDFVRKTSVISFNKNAFLKLSKDVVTFAEAEGLTAHAASVKVRK